MPSNPIFDDNLNVAKTSPLTDLLLLLGGGVFIMVLLFFVLYLLIQWFAPHINLCESSFNIIASQQTAAFVSVKMG